MIFSRGSDFISFDLTRIFEKAFLEGFYSPYVRVNGPMLTFATVLGIVLTTSKFVKGITQDRGGFSNSQP